ncbi:MAG: type II secretion system inner membrane protein GspF [Lautropia sp.]|nr:type II secretion system inner membrane protein GspF [Lautropia sp.]
MPAYRFQAADAAGILHKGIIDADSSRQARAIIRERGQTPIEVVALSAEQHAGHINLGGRLKDADLALCTRQLASLLSARLPLERALNAVVEQAESARIRERFAAVRSDVVSGQTLTQAMAKFPRDFPDTYRALISAGEQSGDLAQVMSRLATYVENRTALVSKVKMAFTYPIIVAVVAVAVIIALLTYVVPQVVSVFNQTRQDLPTLTLILIQVSAFIRHWGWLVLLGAGVAFAAFRYTLRAPTARLSFHAWLLKMPLFGRLIRGINSARFASTLAILSASGVPLIKALDAGANTLNNEAMKAEVREALARVREGAPLARALGAGKTFPPLLVHMIASGEATGELPQMLERAAETLSQEVERKTLTMTTLLEPLLILFTGGIVLMIVLAVLLPIIEINQLVK